MTFKVVIPARFQSTRLPGKPLSDIAGKPMIQRVWEQACRSSAQDVVVATDHESILERCHGFGARAVMTAETHSSGSDRVFEVCESMEWGDDDIVVNLQGDEPLFPPELIDLVANNLREHRQAGIATLCQSIKTWQHYFDPNIVKVVRTRNNFATYFSRAPIPWDRSIDVTKLSLANFNEQGSSYSMDMGVPVGLPKGAFRHVGIYAYRVSSLAAYVSFDDVSVLEKLECLEQLRALENNIQIHCDDTEVEIPVGIDTPEDLMAIQSRIAKELKA